MAVLDGQKGVTDGLDKPWSRGFESISRNYGFEQRSGESTAALADATDSTSSRATRVGVAAPGAKKQTDRKCAKEARLQVTWLDPERLRKRAAKERPLHILEVRPSNPGLAHGFVAGKFERPQVGNGGNIGRYEKVPDILRSSPAIGII
ncbi:hypothetical protein TGRH88_050420 [Toxoplasma gondii]|uniref:Uncharacterized protein n=1 Tax=Toxoplasma gondii TaxID=5811 RepID=A0A7J6JXP4_TOXGO|nr:hypothetical protein TGRH88_050420 [Toxoplasma gondii]